MTNHDVLTFVKAVARGVRSICRTDRLRRQRGFMTRTLGASVEFAKTVNLYRKYGRNISLVLTYLIYSVCFYF
jgi:hypothetical protein